MTTKEIILSVAMLLSACLIGIILGYNMGKNTVYEQIIKTHLEQ